MFKQYLTDNSPHIKKQTSTNQYLTNNLSQRLIDV